MDAGSPETDLEQAERLEVALLTSMLLALAQQARAGDGAAIDRVIKILQLKRQYRRDQLLREVE